ncbi:MAG: VanZ family protein [Methylococcales bacterium]
MIKTLDFLALASYCLFIYWLSDQPHLPAPMWFSNQDKLHHFGAYFVMAVLAWRYFKHFQRQVVLLPLATLSFCSLYGLSDEWHQSFIIGRQSDAMDWLADTIGAGLALLVLYTPKPRRLNLATGR